MGGVIMIIAVVITVLLVVAPLRNYRLARGGALDRGARSFIDDASKVIHERSLGLTPKGKLVGQFGFRNLLRWLGEFHGVEPTVQIPFLPAIDLGVLTTVIHAFRRGRF